ncbi:MAG: BLUF domain-containing protein [Hydrogenophaga sp.]
MFERLVYQSTASHDFGSLHLFNLLTQARMRNERLGITGHLLYFKGQFTQCIEGPSDSISQLWHSLQGDDRHHDIRLIARMPVTHRRFTEWSMAFSSYAALYVHGLTGFFPVDETGTSPLVPLCAAGTET